MHGKTCYYNVRLSSVEIIAVVGACFKPALSTNCYLASLTIQAKHTPGKILCQ